MPALVRRKRDTWLGGSAERRRNRRRWVSNKNLNRPQYRLPVPLPDLAHLRAARLAPPLVAKCTLSIVQWLRRAHRRLLRATLTLSIIRILLPSLHAASSPGTSAVCRSFPLPPSSHLRSPANRRTVAIGETKRQPPFLRVWVRMVLMSVRLPLRTRRQREVSRRYPRMSESGPMTDTCLPLLHPRM